MQLRNKALGASAIGLLAVGAATGLSAQALLHPQSAAESSAPVTQPGAAAHLVPLMTAPNYRAIVAQNQAAVVGITTAGSMPSADEESQPGIPEDNPLAQFFR